MGEKFRRECWRESVLERQGVGVSVWEKEWEMEIEWRERVWERQCGSVGRARKRESVGEYERGRESVGDSLGERVWERAWKRESVVEWERECGRECVGNRVDEESDGERGRESGRVRAWKKERVGERVYVGERGRERAWERECGSGRGSEYGRA